MSPSLAAAVKPRVLFLNRSYFPDAEATGQLLTELCEDLALHFEIRVISGQPNSNPSGAPYVAVGREERTGVLIQRVWHTRFAKSSSIGRMVNWLSYLLMAGLAALTGPRPDVIVVETDPPFLCLLGGLVRWRFGCKLVVYLQDLYPDLGVAMGKLRGGPLIRLLRRAFLAAYRRADRVIVLSDDMRQVLVSAGINPRRIGKIPNWVDTSRVKPIKEENGFRRELGLMESFIVMHSGNMGLCQCLENLIDAAELLRDRDDIAFVLVGDGATRKTLEGSARRRKLDNVRFVDYQPCARLSESLSAADLHLVSVDPRAVEYLMPSKLYGVLASGTPLIAVAPASCELSRIVERNGVGYVVPPGDPAALADRIASLASIPYHFHGMGRGARRLAVERFDRRIGVDLFATLLVELFDQAGSDTMALFRPEPPAEARHQVLDVASEAAPPIVDLTERAS